MNARDAEMAHIVDDALRYGKSSGKGERGVVWYLVGRLGMDVPIDYFDSDPEEESVGC